MKLNKIKKIFYSIIGEHNDEDDEHEWLADQYPRLGFKSYARTRDLTLLKMMGTAMDNRDMHKAIDLNGRRNEILRLLVKAEEYHNELEKKL